jgi:hypothetical protein
VIFKGCDLPQAGVLLTQSPQAEGAWISVRSTNPAVKVPEKVFVPQGATSAAIPFLEIAAVTSPVTGALTASYGGSVRQAPITVRPGGGDLRMKLTPNPVIGGQPVTVELDLPCPGRPLHNVVSMAASPPNAVEFPAFAVVPPDDTHLSFEIKTRPVAGAIRVQITVVTPAGARIETLQIQPAPPPPPPPTPPPVVNLLVNGSFEQPDTSSSPAGWLWFGPAGLPGRPPAAASIPGWKITQGTIDVKAWYWTAKDGKQSLDLVGDNPGAIEQSFATTPGQEYAFSGWIARNPANFYLPEGRGNVFLNGVLFLQLVHRDGSANLTTMHWQPFSARFRATTTLTTLTIVDATGTPFPGGLVLDGLVVNPVGASVSPPPAATKAPAAPSELAATAIAAHQVELRWRDNSSDETGFGVWRREGSSNWVRIGVAAPNVPRFTDRDVKPTRLYIYRVRAHNHDGASAWSDEISVSTPGQ